ncbi:DUF3182 family protein [Pseudomonas sp. DE0010]|uniref:DUF3182 family protein n=1 Tax=Pseudomonas sp. DE0010 TaxID=2584951 RepID=UPI003531F111
MVMPSVCHRKQGVVVLDTRPHTPDHEHAVYRKLSEGFAQLLDCSVVDLHEAPQADASYYYMLTQPLVDTADLTALGIKSEADFFGGAVAHPFMATKAISHPLPPGAPPKPDWPEAFARQACDALLKGYTVFDKATARHAAQLLLITGPVRLKPVRACAGRGQAVFSTLEELEPLLCAMDDAELSTWGLVLEQNLSHVETFSVGQVRVAGLVCSYYGTQQLTQDHQGVEVYGGSDLTFVRGGFASLLAGPLEKSVRVAIEQAMTYDQAADQHLPGFIASRRNYDIARGTDTKGDICSGVLEQSWRMGGASSAELLALQAFAANARVDRVRASTHEVFGTPALPADATLFYQGNDSELGQLTKYARLRHVGHSE